MRRIIYSIVKGLFSWYGLRKLVKRHALDSFHQITPNYLTTNGMQALILDFDGVLAPYGYTHLPKATHQWLDNLCVNMPEMPIFILSNKPISARGNYFKLHFPKIQFVISVRKKPYPDGILEILTKISSPKESVLMVDDRILTGSLAAYISGIGAIYIRKPLTDYTHHPFIEAGFSMLRVVERLLFWVY